MMIVFPWASTGKIFNWTIWSPAIIYSVLILKYDYIALIGPDWTYKLTVELSTNAFEAVMEMLPTKLQNN
jgi:hypothetical protein